MIVKYLDEIQGTEADVPAENGNWRSRRFLLRKDGMGFSFHDTVIKAGTETYIHYANHLEAVYCVAGNGEIEDLDNGKTYQIRDGMMYALNGNERHYLRGGTEDMRMVCVFNPPLTGREVHDENGVYPLIEDE
jgi:L-ectoine synthase